MVENMTTKSLDVSQLEGGSYIIEWVTKENKIRNLRQDEYIISSPKAYAWACYI